MRRVRFGVLFGVAMEALARNKLRSGLTALGIVVGVAAVVTMAGIGEGSKASIENAISSLGSNFVVVYPGIATQGGARIFTNQLTMTEADVAAVRDECPSVAHVSAISRTGGQVVSGDVNWGTIILGVGADFPAVRSWDVRRGAFFEEAAVRSAAKVCLLGSTVAEALFEAEDPVDRIVRIKNIPFRVVGVLGAKGSSLTGQDQDDIVLAPYTTVMRFLKGASKIDFFLASASSPDLVDAAEQEIDALMRQRHRIRPGEDSDFLIRSQKEIASTADQTSSTLSLLLVSVASISLLVGGIGVVNIMLVSVAQRTHEIGLRLAIGARRRDILAQFLVEAVTLALGGGFIGVAVGMGASRFLAWRAHWPFVWSPAGTAAAFALSAAVGVSFGLYPAWRASRLNPIDALRS
jgi:putative ABC transport system permease protein